MPVDLGQFLFVQGLGVGWFLEPFEDVQLLVDELLA